LFLKYTFVEFCYLLPQNVNKATPLEGKFTNVETHKTENKRCPDLVQLVNISQDSLIWRKTFSCLFWLNLMLKN